MRKSRTTRPDREASRVGRDPFRLLDRAARRKAGPGRRRLPQGRAALRPDERPDVGRAAPRLEGRAGRRRCSPPQRPRRSRCSTSPAAPATSPSASLDAGGPARHGHRARHQRATCWPSAASARRARASTASSTSSRAMPRRCRSRTRRFDAYTIAFGIRNVPRIELALARGLSRAQARRALPVPRILAGRRARARHGSTTPIRSTSIPALGKVVAGDGEPYRYLVESIRKFPRPDAFAAMIRRGRLRAGQLTGR